MGLEDSELPLFISAVFFYFGDFHLGCRAANNDSFLLTLLERAYANILDGLEMLTEMLQDFEVKTAKSLILITKTFERLNSYFVSKYLADLIHHYWSKIPLKAEIVLRHSTGALAPDFYKMVVSRILPLLIRHIEFPQEL